MKPNLAVAPQLLVNLQLKTRKELDLQKIQSLIKMRKRVAVVVAVVAVAVAVVAS